MSEDKDMDNEDGSGLGEGSDFGDGEECVDGALELTMDWMDYWSWPIPAPRAAPSAAIIHRNGPCVPAARKS